MSRLNGPGSTTKYFGFRAIAPPDLHASDVHAVRLSAPRSGFAPANALYLSEEHHSLADTQQAGRLIEAGAHEIGGVTAAQLRDGAQAHAGCGLWVMRPARGRVPRLASLIERDGKRGFVVADMRDADDFAPIEPVTLPAGPVCVAVDLDRGDHLAGHSPDEALPAIRAAGRTPLTLSEGIHGLLQRPGTLEPGRCFMTIGSRLRKTDGSVDARALAWRISNGTGRDGPQHRNAPKVGWCWAGNRHTWLGFASAAARIPLPAGRAWPSAHSHPGRARPGRP